LRFFGFLLCWFEFLMRHFTIILVVLNFSNCSFSLLLCLPFVLLRQKGGVFFVLDWECISKSVKCFLSQNGQRGSLLVFYIGNILVDKDTLCNDCFLIGLLVLFRVFKLHGQCLISCHVHGHKFLRRCQWRFHAISKSEQLVPVQPSRLAFEGVRMPRSV